ncbi:MAG: phosphatidate cytidylyltransferase [Gammaproteobacteria bacterium]
MLKYRLLSALVLVPLVIYLILTLSNAQFAFVLFLIMGLAAWEWTRLIPISSLVQRIGYVVLVLALLASCWQFARIDAFVWSIHWLTFIWWLVALMWIPQPQMLALANGFSVTLKAMLGCLLFVSAWLSLVVLHARPDHGPYWMLFVVVLVWVADSGAYFAGKQWGKNKLAPHVSPGKTWEGVYGALAASLFFAWGASNFLHLKTSMLPGFVLVCMIVVLFSIAGDLLESLLKRHQSLKDSGNLIPGHGGMLDRIDSLLAAAPLFSLGLHWVNL